MSVTELAPRLDIRQQSVKRRRRQELNEADYAKLGIQSLAEVERQYIVAVLEYLSWDKPAAARALGVSLNTLYNRIHEYGLNKPPEVIGFFSAPDFTLGRATVSASSDRVSQKQFVCRGCGHWFHDPCPVLPQTHCKACKKAMGEMRSRIFPLQKKAHEKVKNAMARGQLLPPSQLTCRDCGETAECYDHRDYRKPLDVDPVCTRCNIRRGTALPYATPLPEGGGYRLILEHEEQ